MRSLPKMNMHVQSFLIYFVWITVSSGTLLEPLDEMMMEERGHKVASMLSASDFTSDGSRGQVYNPLSRSSSESSTGLVSKTRGSSLAHDQAILTGSLQPFHGRQVSRNWRKIFNDNPTRIFDDKDQYYQIASHKRTGKRKSYTKGSDVNGAQKEWRNDASGTRKRLMIMKNSQATKQVQGITTPKSRAARTNWDTLISHVQNARLRKEDMMRSKAQKKPSMLNDFRGSQDGHKVLFEDSPMLETPNNKKVQDAGLASPWTSTWGEKYFSHFGAFSSNEAEKSRKAQKLSQDSGMGAHGDLNVAEKSSQTPKEKTPEPSLSGDKNLGGPEPLSPTDESRKTKVISDSYMPNDLDHVLSSFRYQDSAEHTINENQMATGADLLKEKWGIHGKNQDYILRTDREKTIVGLGVTFHAYDINPNDQHVLHKLEMDVAKQIRDRSPNHIQSKEATKAIIQRLKESAVDWKLLSMAEADAEQLYRKVSSAIAPMTKLSEEQALERMQRVRETLIDLSKLAGQDIKENKYGGFVNFLKPFQLDFDKNPSIRLWLRRKGLIPGKDQLTTLEEVSKQLNPIMKQAQASSSRFERTQKYLKKRLVGQSTGYEVLDVIKDFFAQANTLLYTDFTKAKLNSAVNHRRLELLSSGLPRLIEEDTPGRATLV